jgi:hypothetical protein
MSLILYNFMKGGVPMVNEKQNGETQGKYAWVSKWAKMTGDRARIDAKANNTYIVYEKNGILVK